MEREWERERVCARQTERWGERGRGGRGEREIERETDSERGGERERGSEGAREQAIDR